jgi:hypothetical protein
MREIVARIVTEMNRDFKPGKPRAISDDELQRLPVPVQKYIKLTKFRDIGHVQTLRLKQKGLFRTGIDANWMPFTAEQYFNVDSLSYIWYAKMKGPLGIKFGAIDRYFDGEGQMLVKIANLYTVADAEGDEIDQGELVRFLSELSLVPSALAKEFIQWEAIDDISAKATLIHNDTQASGIFHFDEEGRILNFTAKRYRSEGKYYFLEDWSIPVSRYGEINKLMLPVEFEANWNLKSGELTYIKVELVTAEYDVPGMF